MSWLILSSISRYTRFYAKFAADSWANMTPSQYGFVLIGVAGFGWLLMKSGNRR